MNVPFQVRVPMRVAQEGQDTIKVLRRLAAKGEHKAHLSVANMLRVAVILGMKRLSRMSPDDLLATLDKEGVVRGRPRNAA